MADSLEQFAAHNVRPPESPLQYWRLIVLAIGHYASRIWMLELLAALFDVGQALGQLHLFLPSGLAIVLLLYGLLAIAVGDWFGFAKCKEHQPERASVRFPVACEMTETGR